MRFRQNEAGRLETSKMVRFGQNLGFIFDFLKILIFGAWGRFFHQNDAKTLGQPEDLKN